MTIDVYVFTLSTTVSRRVFVASVLALGVALGYTTCNKKIFGSFKNIFTKKTGKKQENGVVDPNFNLTEVTFKYTFRNISQIRRGKRDVFSSTIWVGELPWNIMLRPSRLCLESHVICSELYCSWSCCVNLEFSLLGRVPRVLAVDHELYEADSQEEYNRSMGQDIPWEEILDPGNQYIDDDSITFYVNLKVEVLERISWSDRIYLTDDRVNSLVKKYKTNMDILQKKMGQLSKKNEQLGKELKLVKMYKDTHFL
ncbi:hypothetical protein HHI36_019361 [Cryptolaemus montrouzieri]|uniref:MATH domain-containing protein n=1 Tax=Cryptolaemus montrouzieri TaxID=559131 RepID=A0ABD2P3H6_9CUCU